MSQEIPNAHSIERVSTDLNNIPKRCEALAKEVENILNTIEQQGEITASERERLSRVARDELPSKYGYSPVGGSNSVWGRQNRFNYVEDSDEEFREAAVCLGFIPQKLNGDDNVRGHIPALFKPRLERYFSYDHVVNSLSTDLVLLPHTDYHGNRTHIEVGANHTTLEKLEKIEPPEQNRKQFGVLKFGPDELDNLKETFEEHGFSYSIHKGNSTGIPMFEWFPGKDITDYVALKREKGFNPSHKTHSYTLRETLGCGTEEKEAYRRISIETVERLEQRGWSVDWCGHPGCDFSHG